jgi:hypothetical protein
VLFIGAIIIVLGRCVSAFTAGYYTIFLVANFFASLAISVVLGATYIIGTVAEISVSIFLCGKLGKSKLISFLSSLLER